MMLWWMDQIPNIAPNERKPREKDTLYIPWYGRACHRTIDGKGVVGRLAKRGKKRGRRL